MTESTEQGIAKEGYSDPVFFLKFFLPHLFPDEIPWVHRGILAILTKKTDFLLKYGELDKIINNFTWSEDPDNIESDKHAIFSPVYEGNTIVSLNMRITRFSELMLPRGYSKTTLAGIGVILYWILYRDKLFPVYVSETATHSEMQLGNVRTELESNERIKTVFGNIVPDRNSSLKWTGDILQTTTGVTVVARGRGGQIRGLNISGNRPDCILLDDVEDRDSVKTEDQRYKARQWFYADVIPALPEMKEDSTIIALGTLLHPEALLMTLQNDPEWTSIIFGVRDKQGELLWEANMNEKKIEAKKQSFARAGQLAQYYMEYENTVRGADSQKFRPEFFIIQSENRHSLECCGVALDPAISSKAGSDFAAAACAGMNTKGRIVVMDMWGKVGATPREQIDKFFEFQKTYDCSLCGIESIAFQAALIHLAREEMFRKGQYFEIIPIKHSQKKEERIEGILQPRYANGYIQHVRHFPLLETQLLDWPNGKRDFPDALAMCVALLDPAASLAGGNDNDPGKDEYPPLDDLFDGDWRTYQ